MSESELLQRAGSVSSRGGALQRNCFHQASVRRRALKTLDNQWPIVLIGRNVGDCVSALEAGSATTFTVPTVLVAGWPVGATLRVYQAGVGQITIAGAAGATLRGANGLKAAAQYSVFELEIRRGDEWVVTGDAAV